MNQMNRCAWPGHNPLMVKYHDEEWGVPCHADRKLFEYVVLDTFQAGLSWAMILNKRAGFWQAFDNFDAPKIARYNEAKIQALLHDAGIIRNRLKIAATVTNAQAFLKIQQEFGSFDRYIWRFVASRPIIHRYNHNSGIGATSAESDAMSQDLKRRGFKFVGSTVCYAFMQGAGLVNDHLTSCFRHQEVQK